MKSKILGRGPRTQIVGALFTGQSLFSAAVIASFTLTPIVAAYLSGDDSAAGLPSTVTLIGRAAVAYPAGLLLDRIGRRLGLSFGYVIGVVGSIIAAWSVISGSFLGFLTGAALLGGSRAVTEQNRYVAAEMYPAARRAKVIGVIVFAGTIGAILGPLLVEPSGKIADTIGIAAYAGPFVVSALLLTVSMVVIFLWLRPDPLTLSHQVAQDDPDVVQEDSPNYLAARSLRRIFASSVAVLAVFSMMIGQLVMALLMVVTPLHMNHSDHGTQAISLVIMAHTLGMFGLSGVTGWLVDRSGRMIMIAVGAVILVTASILAPVSNAVPMLAVALFLLGLGWNFCFVAGSSLLSDQLASNERGKAQGAGEVAVALGAGLGSLGSGILFASGGISAVSAVGLGFSLVLLVVVSWVAIVARRPATAIVSGHD